MARSPTGTRRFSSTHASGTLALGIALLAAAAMLGYHEGLFIPRVAAVQRSEGLGHGYSFGNDFYQVWLSAREMLRARLDPYSPEMTREIQVGLYGRPLDPHRVGDPVDQRGFPYPAFTDLLFWPVAGIPFETVRIWVLCALFLLTGAGVLLWMRALDWRLGWKWLAVVLLLALSSYPALEGLYAGQLGLLVAFLLAASVVALQREKFMLAGTLLAVSTIKPQMTALVIVYFLFWTLSDWRVRKKFFLGFFSTFAILLGTSLAVLPHWIQSWVHTLLAYRHYTRPPLVTEVLTSPLGPRWAGAATLVLTIVGLVIAVVLAWKNRAASLDSLAFWRTFTLLLAITTITLLPGQAVYDHLILIPAILLLARDRGRLLEAGRVPRILFWLGALVLFWPWLAAFALGVLRPWLAPDVLDATAVLSLPLRTAASLPFVVLALLAWTWRTRSVTIQEGA
ncbi:MAG TPA: glycosyltransferase family 87 protein [Candidatus Dormibacteraeota bacterium]|nr:glycosyltransferase family 87 protein [Candidatus Dormibacteraeota bacterium]